MLVVYRTIGSLRGGCMYKRVDVMAVRVWRLLLARQEWLPEDDVLTSKHVGVKHM